MMKVDKNEIIELLRQLIAAESFSKTEDKTADIIEQYFINKNMIANRLINNVWVKNKSFDVLKPTVLLNSHHDTVKPNSQYTKNPFLPIVEDGKLFGLGSNDAGGALVSLLACFLHFYDSTELEFNIIFAATAEEEISGKNGIELLLPQLGNISFGIVGEPTMMEIAIAEKGLLVIDCFANGITGHAAREDGVNAIYEAMRDIEWFHTFQFPKKSDLLGPVKMSVTMIQAGIQHNVVPEICNYTVDIRTTDAYTNEEILGIIREHISSDILPRSIRLNPSSISKSHPLIKAAGHLAINMYGSPTTSDQALMNFPTIKMGPGDSARSHSADEFIFLNEIEDGIDLYINLLNTIKL